MRYQFLVTPSKALPIFGNDIGKFAQALPVFGNAWVDFKIHSHLQEFRRHHGKYRKAKQAYVSITCKPCSTHIISFTRPSQHPFKWILTRILFRTRLFKSWKQSLSTTKLPVLLSFVIGSNLRIGNWIPLTHKRNATISVAWWLIFVAI